MEFLKKLVPTIGLLVGIVFVAIGGVMGVSSGLKLAFSHPVVYDPTLTCMNTYTPDSKPIVQTPEQITACVEKIVVDEQDRFVQEKINSIIDGATFLLVGAFFWLVFRKKREE